MDEHSLVAGPNGITLLYDDGTTIALGLVGPSGSWRAVVVGHGFVPRMVNDASADGRWLVYQPPSGRLR
jgi:hypothetical protein